MTEPAPQYEMLPPADIAIAEWIALHDGLAPSCDWVKTCLVRLAGAFMLRTQPQQWPAIRKIRTYAEFNVNGVWATPEENTPRTEW